MARKTKSELYVCVHQVWHRVEGEARKIFQPGSEITVEDLGNNGAEEMERLRGLGAVLPLEEFKAAQSRGHSIHTQ